MEGGLEGNAERTTQKRQLPRHQPIIFPQHAMILQLSMPEARNIIAIKVLIRAHFFLALGPKPTGDFALIRPCDFKVLVGCEVDVGRKGVAPLAFALGFRDGGGVEGFEV